MGLRFSFPIELRIDLTSLPQGWKEEVVDALLQDLEGEGIAEIKSLLLQLDKTLGTSQVLVSGAFANLTLSKRSETN
jgi:hypothetical protein